MKIKAGAYRVHVPPHYEILRVYLRNEASLPFTDILLSRVSFEERNTMVEKAEDMCGTPAFYSIAMDAKGRDVILLFPSTDRKAHLYVEYLPPARTV